MWPSSSSNPNQWSFNPAAYQNVPYEQVDWATLAQQWIKMKETLPSVSPGPPPPPAPQISKSNVSQPTKSTPEVSEIRSTTDIEGGEAPMDMDMKDDDVVPPLGVATDSNWKQWNDWQSQWGWGWPGNAGTVPLGEKTSSSASTVNSVDSKVKSLTNDSNPVLNNYVSNVGNFPNNSGTTSTPQVPGSFNYNKIAGGTLPPTRPKSGYYTDNSYSASGKSAGGKLANKNSIQKSAAEQYLPTMDAAKKKQLPAWIREGLNKMEREKQKKMEYERMVQEKLRRDQISPEKPFKNDVFLPNIETAITTPAVDEEIEPSPDRYEKSRSPSVEPGPPRPSTTIEDPNIIRKTKDQIVEESMLKVRRILTEFLLEATENQVAIIAKEELRRKRSASVQQTRKSNALTSLSGNLGLAAYDSDSASSDSERETDDRKFDSDGELEILIEKKKRDFALVEDQIEQEIENQEYKERQVVQRHQEFENDKDIRDSRSYDKDKDSEPPREDMNNHSRLRTSEPDERCDKKDSKVNSASNDKAKHDKQENSSRNSVSNKAKKRRRSSSSSSSSSSSKSSSSSTESTSSSSDHSQSKIDSSSSSSRHSNNKRVDKKSSRKKKVVAEKESKRSKRRAKSRSVSRSRYSRSERSYKDSRKQEDSSERKRSRDHHRMSDSYHIRSSSYRRDSKDSRDSPTSKYRESRKPHSSESKRERRRSRSADQRSPKDSRTYSRR